MFTCSFTTQFKKDYKKTCKRNYDMNLFTRVYNRLEQSGDLPSVYKVHSLKGKWKGTFDAHIEPDWILIYRVDKNRKDVQFVRMGSHSDLFKM